jgi:predicted nucleic acid-binding protein
MNIFIDTNVYLSFYHLSSDDLEELKKLIVLAREGKVVLFLPEQVIDEFHRNRAGKIADALKRLREQRRTLQLPQIARQYEEYTAVRNAQAEFDMQFAALLERLNTDIDSDSLEAGAVIEELFQVAKTIPMTDEIVSKARFRMELGRPPGKKGSLGDAINWEALLAEVAEGEDLYFVSDDGDYESPLDKSHFSPYLENEWSASKHSEVLFYKRLSALFREEFPDIELASELEKDLLIRELAETESFAGTHATIAKLSRFSDYTRSQVNDLVTAAVTHNQVYWIAKDPDIIEFYDSLLKGREDLVDPDNLKRLRYAQQELEPYHEIPF